MPIETPRLVKKPGPPVEYKRVENQRELDAALAEGWLLRLTPAAASASSVAAAPAGIDVPRLVKKPGGLRLRVETLDDLSAALAEGWSIQTPPEPVVAAPEASEADAAQAEEAESLEMPDPADSTATDGRFDDVEGQIDDSADTKPDEPKKRGPGRPRKNG